MLVKLDKFRAYLEVVRFQASSRAENSVFDKRCNACCICYHQRGDGTFQTIFLFAGILVPLSKQIRYVF